MPQSDAGCRIEPPVSEPHASGTIPDATAAAEPPLEPPGTFERSHGLQVVNRPLFSVEEPMANSSMFVLPTRHSPASTRRRVTVASYGGCHSPRMREAQVVL